MKTFAEYQQSFKDHIALARRKYMMKQIRLAAAKWKIQHMYD